MDPAVCEVAERQATPLYQQFGDEDLVRCRSSGHAGRDVDGRPEDVPPVTHDRSHVQSDMQRQANRRREVDALDGAGERLSGRAEVSKQAIPDVGGLDDRAAVTIHCLA